MALFFNYIHYNYNTIPSKHNGNFSHLLSLYNQFFNYIHYNYNTISSTHNGNFSHLLCVYLPIFITIVLVFNRYNYALNTLGTIMLCVFRCSSGISYRLALHGSESPMCDSLIRNISLCLRHQARHGRRDPAGPEPDR